MRITSCDHFTDLLQGHLCTDYTVFMVCRPVDFLRVAEILPPDSWKGTFVL